jgi:hypothetical protein
MKKVIVAGCGAAGSFLALRALQLGFEPTMLRAPIRAVGGVEIVPASAWRLLDALGLDGVLGRIGVGLGDGLTRRQADGTVDTVQGRSLHVDRLKLRAALLSEAERRGAAICDVKHLPAPDPATFAIDATGLRAAWSHPVQRRGRQRADLFAAEEAVRPGSARVAWLDRGWAYLASDQQTATIGVVGRYGRGTPVLDADTRRCLDIARDARFRFLGRRPAFVQWTTRPVAGRRLTIGDAACHHDPIGGRGLSFALGSAFAAATVLATWRDDPSARDVAQAYYEEYVASEVRRHLAFLDDEAPADIVPEVLPTHIRWLAPTTAGGLAVDGRVAAGEVFKLASGQSVRWAGGFDLVELRKLTSEIRPSEWVAGRLCALGLAPAEARSTLSWALENGLIGPAGPSGLRIAG